MSQMTLTVERRSGGIVVVVLNRPERLNALDDELLAALPSALDSLARDISTRVVILTGAGAGFCAGADLTSLRAISADRAAVGAWMRRGQRGCASLRRLPQPTIAAVNGAAAGAGLGLALGCDLRVGAATASFSAPFVRMGLCPDF